MIRWISGLFFDGAAFASTNPISNFLVQHNSHRGIDGIFLTLASATENDASCTDLLALHRGKISGFHARNLHSSSRLWKPRDIIDDPSVAALKLDHLSEFLQSLAGGNQSRALLLPFRDRFSGAAQMQHPSGKFEAEFAQVPWTPAFQNVDALHHLQRISNHVSERLIHIRNERDHLFAHALTGVDHHFG